MNRMIWIFLWIAAVLPTFNAINNINSYTKGSFSRDPESRQAEMINAFAKDGRATSKEREQLYEAYNLLHSLAQDFHKPFDSPAVIVVGHQTSGKSALIEALMGFQFNQVGGGTKTRRPVALRMQYNPKCTTPVCFLTMENGREEQRSLEDIQAYIESENKRLERDPRRSFDAREINIRMEYKYCPNMIVIDTPGMIHPPKGKQLTPQQRALAQAAREAEQLILSKIRCQDYIILCVEDTTDWKHATTRNVVMQADPQLARTVLVTTKLDTKIPQFSEGEDLDDFLRAPLVAKMYSQLLGGPFFTSVPAGRVGISRDFDNNQAFVASLLLAEKTDRNHILAKVGPMNAKSTINRVGVSKLRSYLELRVEETYRRNVAKIVPLLQNELRHAESKLADVETELQTLSLDKLKLFANQYRDRFAKELNNAIQGTIKASPDEFGETLESEQLNGGSFVQLDQIQSEQWQQILEAEVGNGHHKLFGGAQYHRAIKEFTLAVRHMVSPQVSEDEIANAAGMGDSHNGVNFMRAACVIAMEKAQMSFDPVLESLKHRSVHVMKRLFPAVEEMVRKSSNMSPVDPQNQPFIDVVRQIYDKFVDKQIDDCLKKCRDDLNGMTRFVTWDMEDKGGSSTLFRLLPTPKKMVEIYTIALDKSQSQANSPQQLGYDQGNSANAKKLNMKRRGGGQAAAGGSAADRIMDEWSQANKDSKKSDGKANNNNENSNYYRQNYGYGNGMANNNNNKMVPTPYNQPVQDDPEMSDYYKVIQLTEEMLSGSSASRTSGLITSLVQYIISSWRNHFARSTAMKFNCFFLLPFMDDFPIFLRQELDEIYANGFTDMFDVVEARKSLQNRRSLLIAECDANSKLQERFDQIARQLRSPMKTFAVEADDADDVFNEMMAAQSDAAMADFDEYSRRVATQEASTDEIAELDSALETLSGSSYSASEQDLIDKIKSKTKALRNRSNKSSSVASRKLANAGSSSKSGADAAKKSGGGDDGAAKRQFRQRKGFSSEDLDALDDLDLDME